MVQDLMWAGLAAAMLGAGWWASARHHQRKIDRLLLQLRVTRQAAQAHTDQARRQIGQLQAELASRPPAPQPPEAPDTSDGSDAPASPDTRIQALRRKAAAPDRFEHHDDGFAHTAITGTGFAPTELQR